VVSERNYQTIHLKIQVFQHGHYPYSFHFEYILLKCLLPRDRKWVANEHCPLGKGKEFVVIGPTLQHLENEFLLV